MGGLVFKFPRNVALDEVTQQVTRDKSKLIGQTIMPFVEKVTQLVEWDEKDNEQGMTAVHTMGTEPKIADRPGSKTHQFKPIPHKEEEVIKEDEILSARALGTLGGVVNLNDLVMERFNAGVDKDWVRMEWEIWQALRGHLQINENGVLVNEVFPIQTFDAVADGVGGVYYDDLANATPLADSNRIKLMFRNTGASAQGAKEYMNQATLNLILENKNNDDIRGFNEGFRAITFDLAGLNKMNTTRGLPEIVPYDEGVEDKQGNFTTFIPDGESIIVGKRMPGQLVGDYVLTPTAHRNKGGMPAPGFFAFITINGRGNASGAISVSFEELGAAGNPKVGVIHGFYGGPRLKYPRSIIRRKLRAA
ncbi:MAG: major capsid protein [Blastocatellia bacterium]